MLLVRCSVKGSQDLLVRPEPAASAVPLTAL